MYEEFAGSFIQEASCVIDNLTLLDLVIPAHAGTQGILQGGGMERQPCVYLLASKRNGTLYTGVTSNLLKRVWEHKNNLSECFTSKYGVHTLVWYEIHDTMESAI